MRKFLQGFIEKRFSLFELLALGMVAISSIFIGNFIIIIPGCIFVIVLNIILKHLLEEEIHD